MSVAPMRRTKSLSSDMDTTPSRKKNKIFLNFRGLSRSKSRDNTPLRRREKSDCEYYDENKIDDGDLPSLKKSSSMVNDDEIQSVISRASNLSPTSRRKHRAFWNQLDVDHEESKSSEDDAPDDEASAYTEARLRKEEEEREKKRQRETEKRLAAALERKRQMDRKLSEKKKEEIEYDSDSDEGFGGLIGLVHRLCNDCDDPKYDDKKKDSMRDEYPKRRKSGTGSSRRHREIKLSPSDDDFFENTAIEVEYVDPRSIQLNDSGISRKSKSSKSRKKEGFLQLDNSGDVAVMVGTKKPSPAKTPQVITTNETEESMDIPNVLSDLSEDEDVVRQPVSQKNALLNHLANEAMLEFTKKKQEEVSQKGTDSDDELSEIFSQWEEQRSTKGKEEKIESTISNTTETTQNDSNSQSQKSLELSASLNNEKESVAQPTAVMTEPKSRSLEPPQNENDHSRKKQQNEVTQMNHVGEIDKKAMQEKLLSGASIPKRISRVNNTPSSPARSLASSNSRLNLMPKLKKSSVSSKGFAPVIDDDDRSDEDQKATANSAKKPVPDAQTPAKTEKDIAFKKIKSELASPQGVDQLSSSLSPALLKSMSYGALDNPSVRSKNPSSKSDIGAGLKLKGFTKLKGKKKDSFTTVETSMLMKADSSTTKTNPPKSPRWVGKKKRDKKTNSNWQAIEDDFEDEGNAEIERMMKMSNSMQSQSGSIFIGSSVTEKSQNRNPDDVSEKGRIEEEKKDEIISDDISFTDDKTVATNNIRDSMLGSPIGLKMNQNITSLDLSTISSKGGDIAHIDDAKSVYSTGTGLSLASAWSSASTATSTRRRHRGAAKGRTQVSQQKKPTGWYDSIQAAAAKNQRVWDPKLGWIDYVEPDKETLAEGERIGALSIKTESVKKSTVRNREQLQNIDPIPPIPPPPPPPSLRSPPQPDFEKSPDQNTPPRSIERDNDDFSKSPNQNTPPRSIEGDNDDSYIDNESLEQPSLASTATESIDQIHHSPLQFLPSKALSMERTSESTRNEENWISTTLGNDQTLSTPLPDESLTEENNFGNSAFIGVEYESMSNNDASDSEPLNSTNNVEKNGRNLDVIDLEVNNEDENSEHTLTDVTGASGGSGASNASGGSGASNASGDTEYQSLDESEHDNSENDSLEKVDRKEEASNLNQTINGQNIYLDEALLDDEDLHDLYDWLDHEEKGEKGDNNIFTEPQEFSQGVGNNNKIQLEESVAADSIPKPLPFSSSNDSVEKKNRSTDHQHTASNSSSSKENLQQILNEAENDEFDFADFSRESFEGTKNAPKQSIDKSLHNESNSTPQSPYDQNGFKVIKRSTYEKWGKTQSYTSLSDHSGDLDGVQSFSASDSDEDNDDNSDSQADENSPHQNHTLETLHEVSSTQTEDDVKSVKTIETGIHSVNSVSSRAKAWMELMEGKKSKYEISQRKREVKVSNGIKATQYSNTVNQKIDENSVDATTVSQKIDENSVDATTVSQKIDENPVNDGTASNQNPDGTVASNDPELTELPNVKSDDKSYDEVERSRWPRSLSPDEKEKGPMFISAADDNSFFKFAREKQDDEDTLFSNLDAESVFSKPAQSSRKSLTKVQSKTNGYGTTSGLDMSKNPQNEVISFETSFDDNTLNTRSTMGNDAEFEINSSFQMHQREHKPQINNFFSRVASACEPMMPGALQCSNKKASQEGEAVPLAHLAFLQRRSVSNVSRSSPTKFSFINPELCGRSGKSGNNTVFSNSQYSESEGRVGSPISNYSQTIEQKSDIGNSSSYLATMEKIKSDVKKKKARSNASNGSSNNSRSQAWSDFIERRSQSGGKSSKRSNSGVSATAEKYAAKRVEEMMKSLSNKSDASGRKDVQNMLDSMSIHGSEMNSDIHPSPPTRQNSNRVSNERFATARVEAMMAVMSSNGLDQGEI